MALYRGVVPALFLTTHGAFKVFSWLHVCLFLLEEGFYLPTDWLCVHPTHPVCRV